MKFFIVTKSQQNYHVVLVLKSWDWVRPPPSLVGTKSQVSPKPDGSPYLYMTCIDIIRRG